MYSAENDLPLFLMVPVALLKSLSENTRPASLLYRTVPCSSVTQMTAGSAWAADDFSSLSAWLRCCGSRMPEASSSYLAARADMVFSFSDV